MQRLQAAVKYNPFVEFCLPRAILENHNCLVFGLLIFCGNQNPRNASERIDYLGRASKGLSLSKNQMSTGGLL